MYPYAKLSVICLQDTHMLQQAPLSVNIDITAILQMLAENYPTDSSSKCSCSNSSSVCRPLVKSPLPDDSPCSNAKNDFFFRDSDTDHSTSNAFKGVQSSSVTAQHSNAWQPICCCARFCSKGAKPRLYRLLCRHYSKIQARLHA